MAEDNSNITEYNDTIITFSSDISQSDASYYAISLNQTIKEFYIAADDLENNQGDQTKRIRYEETLTKLKENLKNRTGNIIELSNDNIDLTKVLSIFYNQAVDEAGLDKSYRLLIDGRPLSSDRYKSSEFPIVEYESPNKPKTVSPEEAKAVFDHADGKHLSKFLPKKSFFEVDEAPEKPDKITKPNKSSFFSKFNPFNKKDKPLTEEPALEEEKKELTIFTTSSTLDVTGKQTEIKNISNQILKLFDDDNVPKAKEIELLLKPIAQYIDVMSAIGAFSVNGISKEQELALSQAVLNVVNENLLANEQATPAAIKAEDEIEKLPDQKTKPITAPITPLTAPPAPAPEESQKRKPSKSLEANSNETTGIPTEETTPADAEDIDVDTLTAENVHRKSPKERFAETKRAIDIAVTKIWGPKTAPREALALLGLTSATASIVSSTLGAPIIYPATLAAYSAFTLSAPALTQLGSKVLNKFIDKETPYLDTLDKAESSIDNPENITPAIDGGDELELEDNEPEREYYPRSIKLERSWDENNYDFKVSNKIHIGVHKQMSDLLNGTFKDGPLRKGAIDGNKKNIIALGIYLEQSQFVAENYTEESIQYAKDTLENIVSHSGIDQAELEEDYKEVLQVISTAQEADTTRDVLDDFFTEGKFDTLRGEGGGIKKLVDTTVDTLEEIKKTQKKLEKHIEKKSNRLEEKVIKLEARKDDIKEKIADKGRESLHGTTQWGWTSLDDKKRQLDERIERFEEKIDEIALRVVNENLKNNFDSLVNTYKELGKNEDESKELAYTFLDNKLEETIYEPDILEKLQSKLAKKLGINREQILSKNNSIEEEPETDKELNAPNTIESAIEGNEQEGRDAPTPVASAPDTYKSTSLGDKIGIKDNTNTQQKADAIKEYNSDKSRDSETKYVCARKNGKIEPTGDAVVFYHPDHVNLNEDGSITFTVNEDLAEQHKVVYPIETQENGKMVVIAQPIVGNKAKVETVISPEDTKTGKGFAASYNGKEIQEKYGDLPARVETQDQTLEVG